MSHDSRNAGRPEVSVELLQVTTSPPLRALSVLRNRSGFVKSVREVERGAAGDAPSCTNFCEVVVLLLVLLCEGRSVRTRD